MRRTRVRTRFLSSGECGIEEAPGYCRGVYYFILQRSVNDNVCGVVAKVVIGVVTGGADWKTLQERSLPLLRAVCANINA